MRCVNSKAGIMVNRGEVVQQLRNVNPTLGEVEDFFSEQPGEMIAVREVAAFMFQVNAGKAAHAHR